ncbi:hypothetical protein C8J57DRAFT_58040 [Mycena rebaudengoi]|nr:hypothetical protein C8J57DRAFT_58040 [Mycena rebaudengoi]
MPAWYVLSSCSASAGVALSSVRVMSRMVLFWRERVEGEDDAGWRLEVDRETGVVRCHFSGGGDSCWWYWGLRAD